ncbi:MAG: hypothetical protein NT157_05575 [Candidatus Micrarchaeota archaeon]|nr:hypothetical protein [Candidatus Micrarchaeota archaeon]
MKKMDEKTEFEFIPARQNTTRVHVREKPVKEDAAFSFKLSLPQSLELFDSKNNPLSAVPLSLLETLANQIAKAEKKGATREEITGALNGLSERRPNKLGIGEGISLFDGGLKSLLSTLKSFENAKGGLLRNVYFKFGGEISLQDRIGYVAKLAYVSDAMGISAMGQYELKKNDCFDFVACVLAHAYGPEFARKNLAGKDQLNLVERERRLGGLSDTWYTASRQDRTRALADSLSADASLMLVYSKYEDGQDHWGICCRESGGKKGAPKEAVVYNYTGIVKREPVKEFGETGVRLVLTPVETQGHRSGIVERRPKGSKEIAEHGPKDRRALLKA